MDIDDMLIEKVKHHPILFDYAHSEYRNLKKKEHAWREIAATLNLNVRDCKRRWKGLRDSYKRCKRKGAESSSGAKMPRKQWRYFGAMTFLDNVTSTRRNESSDPLSRSSQNLTPSPGERVDNKYFLSQTSQSSTTPSSRENEDSKHVQSRTRQSSTTSSSREKEKAFSDDFKEFIDLAGSSISDNFESKVCQPQVENLKQALDSTQVLESNQAQYSTTTLFGILAAKIKHTNLPPCVVNRIEAQVSAIVFGEIESFYSAMNKSI